jgi:NADP-dependent aldehyde dehydrogenase
MDEYQGQNFIGGKRSGFGSKHLFSNDAVTGEPLNSFYEATLSEIDAAVQAAELAYPHYRNTLPADRAVFLELIADEIDGLDNEFVRIACQETAYSSTRIASEKERTIAQLRYFAQILRDGDFLDARIDLPLPKRNPFPKPDIRQVKIGIGPVAVFGAGNFPLAFSTAGGDTVSALAAGCPVVVKAHPSHMNTGETIARAIERAIVKAKIPLGTFNMIYGVDAGRYLILHPAIKAVGFTGSNNVGKILADLVATREIPIPVFAEMSSINPIILFPNAISIRAESIAQQLFDSLVLGAGQFCTNPGLLIAFKSPYLERFITKLKTLINEFPGQTMLNPGVLKNYQDRVKVMEEYPGVEVIAGGAKSSTEGFAYFFRADATLFIDGDEDVRTELFGPATVLVEVDSLGELRQVLNSLNGQLTTSLFANSEDFAKAAMVLRWVEEKVGRILLNDVPTGVEVSDSMVHGGPYPATSDGRSTSVGGLAIERWLRPVCYQNFPDFLLPKALKNANPLEIERRIDGIRSKEPIVTEIIHSSFLS